MRDKGPIVGAVAIAACTLAMGGIIGHVISDAVYEDEPEIAAPATFPAIPLAADVPPPDTSVCKATVPMTPEHDPCATAASYMRAGFLPNLQGAAYFTKWKAANPAEWQRIQNYLGDPAPWTSDSPRAVATRTFYGNMIRDAISMCKAALCGGQALPPASRVAADTQAPSMPGGITVTP